jgi:hypothetical protein
MKSVLKNNDEARNDEGERKLECLNARFGI